MKKLQDFQPSHLMSLLAKETISYYKLMGDGASVEECTQCNNRIAQIRREIESRKNPDEKNIPLRKMDLRPMNIHFNLTLPSTIVVGLLF
jgi:hypothetical protein